MEAQAGWVKKGSIRLRITSKPDKERAILNLSSARASGNQPTHPQALLFRTCEQSSAQGSRFGHHSNIAPTGTS
jgi:hypothetical protein